MNAGQQLDFVVLHPVGMGSNYTVVGKTGLVTLAGTGAVETFPGQHSRSAGDILGFWTSTGFQNPTPAIIRPLPNIVG